MDPNVAGSSPVDRPLSFPYFFRGFVEIWQSALLGIVQGITEFFPVSSSAHLKLVRTLLEIEGDWLYFDLACHLGTFGALLFWMRLKLLNALKDWRLFFLALIPLVPAYMLFKYFHLSKDQHTGYFLIISSLLLFLGIYQKSNNPVFNKKSSLLIGSMQAISLLPGLSRSASTMVGARFCGKSWKEAANFSFLLAIPTILGGEIIESFKVFQSSKDIPWDLCLVGALSSLITGLLAVRVAFRVYEKGTLAPLAWYCRVIGALTIGLYG